MKSLLFQAIALLFALQLTAQTEQIDPRAITILDRMSNLMGNLNSCSFKVHVTKDVPSDFKLEGAENFVNIKKSMLSEVYLSGPTKLLVNKRGDGGHKGLWYNGDQVFWYSYAENNYVVVDAPDSNTVDMMYYVNDEYGIEFPAADFFNPYFTDDLMDNSDIVQLIGLNYIEGKVAYHVLAVNHEMAVQFWIADDAKNLPVRMVIEYIGTDHSQYVVTFSEWSLNPDIPDAMFEFDPPPGASQISIAPRYSTNQE